MWQHVYKNAAKHSQRAVTRPAPQRLREARPQAPRCSTRCTTQCRGRKSCSEATSRPSETSEGVTLPLSDRSATKHVTNPWQEVSREGEQRERTDSVGGRSWGCACQRWGLLPLQLRLPKESAPCLTTLSHLIFVIHFPVVCRNHHHNWGVNCRDTKHN